MPLPKPTSGEKKSNFLDRCMSDAIAIGEFADEKQRFAVCSLRWEESLSFGKSLFNETYNDYPESASNNAKKVLRWREQHGDEVKGMTAIGWKRANQLSSRQKISRKTIARMASFKRHQRNAKIDPKFESKPWKDRGYVAWLGWGGTSGVEWAIRKLKQIDNKSLSKMETKETNQQPVVNLAFSVLAMAEAKVNKRDGILTGVSLISTGPAIGHGLYVDDTSIDTILEKIGSKIPAYITHSGALFSDRLTNEIGMFENFRKEGNRILADFEAFDSFMEDDTREFNRLFEMAEKMPERFGLSIVFSATKAWATPDGDLELDERPENALFDYPSIRAEEISSADFVDTPAANEKGLFSQNKTQPNLKMTKIELSERNELLEAEKDELLSQSKELSLSVSGLEAEKESLNLTLNEKEDEIQSMRDQIKEKMEEIQKLESNISEIEKEMEMKDEEVKEKAEEIDSVINENQALSSRLNDLESKVSSLKSIIEGSSFIEFSAEDGVYQPSESNRSKVISEFAKENKISEFAATLRLGKERPELFKI
jgi:uncharacterized protein YukE